MPNAECRKGPPHTARLPFVIRHSVIRHWASPVIRHSVIRHWASPVIRHSVIRHWPPLPALRGCSNPIGDDTAGNNTGCFLRGTRIIMATQHNSLRVRFGERHTVRHASLTNASSHSLPRGSNRREAKRTRQQPLEHPAGPDYTPAGGGNTSEHGRPGAGAVLRALECNAVVPTAGSGAGRWRYISERAILLSHPAPPRPLAAPRRGC
jgi:hypothetical protein